MTDLSIHGGSVDANQSCTSGVGDMSSWFLNKTTFDMNISHWDTSSVTDMSSMFYGATLFNQDIGDWDTSSVTTLSNTFNGAIAFNQDIGGWDVSNVTEMAWMFNGSLAFYQDISSWCVSGIPSKPSDFDTSAHASFINNTSIQPNWGYCGAPKIFLKAHGGAVQISDGYVDLSTLASSATDNITYEAWFNWDGTATDMAIFDLMKASTDGTGIHFDGTTGKAYLWIAGAGNYATDFVVSPNTWNHVAYVRENGTWKTYINGDAASFVAQPTALPHTPVTYGGIGEIPGYANTLFSGMIDEVRFWESGRTASEIKDNYNKQLDGNEAGLIAYYNFDERIGDVVVDIAGGDYNGTIEGNVTRLNFLGDGLKFDAEDGTQDKIDLGVNLDNNTLTIGAWINFIAQGESYPKTIFSTGYDGANKNSYFYVNSWGTSDRNLVYESTGSSASVSAGAGAIKEGEWTYVSVVVDDVEKTSTLYINGEVVAQTNFTGSKTTATGNAHIGIGGNGNWYFNGDMAEVSLWHKALTSAEINTTMHSALKGDETGLVGYWPLNEGNGTIAYDRQTNSTANNGTITGAEWNTTAPEIYGDTIYTTEGISVFTKSILENNTSEPIYTKIGGTGIVAIDSTLGFIHYTPVSAGSDSFTLAAGTDSLTLPTNVVIYGSSVQLTTEITLTLANYGSLDENVTNLFIVDPTTINDATPTSISLSTASLTSLLGGSSVTETVPFAAYMLIFETDMGTADEKRWYYNFTDGKLYDYVGSNPSSDYYSNATTVAPDVVSTNWIDGYDLTVTIDFGNDTPATLGIVSVDVNLTVYDANYSGYEIDEEGAELTGGADIVVSIPLSTSEFYISYEVNSSKYIKKGYYSHTDSTVYSKGDITPMNVSEISGAVTLPIDRGYKISGTLTNYGTINKGFIYPIRTDGKDPLRYGTKVQSDDTYFIRVPTGYYKLKAMVGSSDGAKYRDYYNSNGTEKLESEAEEFSVSGTTTGIDFSGTDTGNETLSYSAGWNLFSMPNCGYTKESDFHILFDDTEVSHLVKYTPAVGWSYHWIDDDNVESEYPRFSEIDAKEGFWLKAAAGGSVKVPLTGTEPTSLDSSYLSSSLETGWNLIGFPMATNAGDINTLITSNGGVVDAVWIYRSGGWLVHYPNYSVQVTSTLSGSEEIKCTEGIWIKLNTVPNTT